jgi:argininosuccinate lyase
MGPKASNIHLGRSRNDLGETMNRMGLRKRLLETLQRILAIRASIIELASAHIYTLMPGFTHAVQAQPTTVAHYLLALDSHLQRDAERLWFALNQVNQSPLGAGALTTSSFGLDRKRLASLLGFDGLIVNSYDAIAIASADSKLVVANALSLHGSVLGRFAQDMLRQYDDIKPGFIIGESATRRSSIMPQKRNPGVFERLRVAATETMSEAHTAALMVHNTPLYEVRDTRAPLYYKTVEIFAHTEAMHHFLQQALEALVINVEALSQLVVNDYSMMTELADRLYVDYGIDFRSAYAFASALTTEGRQKNLKPSAINNEQLSGIWKATLSGEMPFSYAWYVDTVNPHNMIEQRASIGGPQSQSSKTMIESARQNLQSMSNQIDQLTQRIRHSEQTRQAALKQLVNAVKETQ